RCSATSRRTSSEKCTLTSERGTWPFRNPGRRASFCTRPYARSHSFWTTSTGASMARRRLQPSIGSTATFIDTPVWRERGEYSRRSESITPRSGRHGRPPGQQRSGDSPNCIGAALLPLEKYAMEKYGRKRASGGSPVRPPRRGRPRGAAYLHIAQAQFRRRVHGS